MPTYEVTSPDGKTWEVTAPEGASQDQVLAYAKQQWSAQVKEPPAAVKAGSALKDIPRQLGLTARYAMEGAPALADTLLAPIRVGLNAAGLNVPTLSQGGAALANAMGLPQPQGANERVVGDMTRMLAGAAGGIGPAQALASRAPGAVAEVAKLVAANPGQQLASAVSAGGAGGAVREAGGGTGAQVAASVAGGLAGGLGASALSNAGRRVTAAMNPKMEAQQVEQKITLTLRGSGIDWNQVPERVKQGLRADVTEALRTGADLDAAALRRLLDFRATGTTPTRGMLTQDPVQITREQNLAKVGANSLDVGLQRLPNIQNANARALLGQLDEMGARGAPDAYTAGERVIGALQSDLGRAKNTINTLYERARDTSGRSAQLDNYAFTSAANQALDDALLGYAVPSSVQNKLNQIAKGEVPFTVDFAEQLKTVIGDIGRAGKGDATTRAMGVIRRALDETPLRGQERVNPGNLPAVMGTVPESTAGLGEESIRAFNRARRANRGLMGRVERSPALEEVFKAAREGQAVDPDKFVQRFITGGGASVADVGALRRAVNADPQARQAVRQFIASHLKSAATNGTEDVVKYSSSAYSKALDAIGERKLSAFFSPQEIAQMQAVKRAGTLMQAQPVGTAVNNSNSGALLAAKAFDFLDSLVGKLPAGLNTALGGVIQGVQQGKALKPAQALALPRQENALSRLGLQPLLYGNLLAAPVVD